MYICNKCGKETFNPDMVCDNCRPIKEEEKVIKKKNEESASVSENM